MKMILKFFADCVSNAIFRRRTFNDLTFTAFNESCVNNNVSYLQLRESLRPIWDTLTANITTYCAGPENVKLITELVNGTLKCFDQKSYSSKSEIKKIVTGITKKLCSYYKLGKQIK